ncbi:hypothetical protein F511_33588 [Dorcoceras hygrometricum]|uniref:Uncharacterized protein n=1 Tax=Dorcoceras hygrometricum TaxID=472368 RepID=A0A2Z7A285_9LAMI|nr:hypothetical protein F511_33588 [Dorcoceras hygrometricum]
MKTGYQESSVDKKKSTTTQLCRSHQSSSSCDFRYDDSADHHKAVWYLDTTTQPTTTSTTALDLSGTMTQPADHNVQRNSALKGIRLNITADVIISVGNIVAEYDGDVMMSTVADVIKSVEATMSC